MSGNVATALSATMPRESHRPPVKSTPDRNYADHFGDDEYDALGVSPLVESGDMRELAAMMEIMTLRDVSAGYRAYREEAIVLEAEIASRRAMSFKVFMALQLGPVAETPTTLEAPITSETPETPKTKNVSEQQAQDVQDMPDAQDMPEMEEVD